ncbi:MAG: response regulator [Ferruginibacter sp.]
MKNFSILLVEDNEADVFLTTQLLSDVGINKSLHVVRDGADAIDYIFKSNNFQSASTPDLIILDINLPKVNGKDILTKVRAESTFKEIPIVMYSSSDSPEEIKTCYERAANLYLVKSFTSEEYEYNVNELKAFVQCNLQNASSGVLAC